MGGRDTHTHTHTQTRRRRPPTSYVKGQVGRAASQRLAASAHAFCMWSNGSAKLCGLQWRAVKLNQEGGLLSTEQWLDKPSRRVKSERETVCRERCSKPQGQRASQAVIYPNPWQSQGLGANSTKGREITACFPFEALKHNSSHLKGRILSYRFRRKGEQIQNMRSHDLELTRTARRGRGLRKTRVRGG